METKVIFFDEVDSIVKLNFKSETQQFDLNQIQNIYIKTAKILFWKRYTLTIINKDKKVFQYPFSAKKRNHIKKEVFNIIAAIRFT
jgi:hypothetical protein